MSADERTLDDPFERSRRAFDALTGAADAGPGAADAEWGTADVLVAFLSSLAQALRPQAGDEATASTTGQLIDLRA